MSAIDNTRPFTTALQADSREPLSPSLIDEALKIHTSHNLAELEKGLGETYLKDPKSILLTRNALEKTLDGQLCQKDSVLSASIYRDIAVINQAAAATKMGKDDLGAATMLYSRSDDRFNTMNVIANVEKLDPNNPDLSQLHSIQERLTAQLKRTAQFRPVGQLNEDAMSSSIANYLNQNWDKAIQGAPQAAADLQVFVDRAERNPNDPFLNKVLNKVDSHVAAHLKDAIIRHDSILFT